jgi:hypothetical protein
MKLQIIIVIAMLVTVNCDLLDGNFFQHVYKNILANETAKVLFVTRVRFLTMNLNAAYDAIVPYRSKSIGINSNIPKRPDSERTQRNKNIAIAYAFLRVSQNVYPPVVPKLESLYHSLGLDLTDTTLDLTTPIGIGNFAGKNLIEDRINDGINQLGNLNDKKYNRIPYEDYTGYVPKNTAYELKFPGKWQPLIENLGYGVFTVQQCITPQLAITKTFAVQNINNYSSPEPTLTNPSNKIQFKNQVDDVLNESANLNDYKKMLSEYFETFDAYYDPILYLTKKNPLSQDDFLIINLLAMDTFFDSLVVQWKEKLKYDTVRPMSAVKYLYENTNLTAWGGPGEGTVSDITGREWISYLPTGALGEYPGGTACICSAYFNLLKRFVGTNEFGFSIIKAKGSSSIEPNITPATNITFGPFKTFDDYIDECALTRIWSGVHFRASNNEGKRLCKPIGGDVYDHVMKYVTGSAQ